MSRVASHILYGATLLTSGVTEMAFQQSPVPILWAIRKDGQLIGMTYEIQEQVYAWFRMVTDGEFESVCVLSMDGEEDQVWAVVKRTINGATKRYIEFFMPHNFYSVIADAFFVHSGLSSTIASQTHVHAPHLALKAVDVVIAGTYIGRITATADGTINFGATYSGKCIVGLPYTSKLEPMKIHVGDQRNTSRGQKEKVNRVTVCLYETCAGKIGPDANNLIDIDHAYADGTLFTGDINHEFYGDWDDGAKLHIEQEKPYPMTVLALVPRITVSSD